MLIPPEILQQARQATQEQQWDKSEKIYKELITILETNMNDSDDCKMELWSTKAEYLQAKPWIFKEETLEQFRHRILDSIRYIYKCTKLNEEYKKIFTPFLNQTIKQLILTTGCIVPENDTHVIMTCPIQLRQTKFGRMGSSIAGFYKKALCSICGLDMLDEKCIHEPSKPYDGKICKIEPQDFQFLHLLGTSMPKDPRCVAQMICHPKSDYYEHFDKEIIQKKIKQNAPMGCTFCKEINYDPSEITAEKFFEMQGVSIEFDKKFEFPKFDMKPNGYYISYPIWFGSDSDQVDREVFS